MFGINKNGTKEKIGILLPASYPSGQCSYDNTSSGMTATDVQDAIDELCTDVSGKVSKSGDTMSGNLTVDRANGTTATDGVSGINLGNAIASGVNGNSYGRMAFYGKGSNYTIIQAPNSTATRDIKFPDASGTIALTSDLDTKVSKSGDTMSGNLTIDRQDGVPLTGGQSILTLGNNLGIDQDKNSEGLVYLYSMTGKKTVLTSTADRSDKIIEFPNKGGTVALTSDIENLEKSVYNYNSNAGSVTYKLPSPYCSALFYANKNGSGAISLYVYGMLMPIIISSNQTISVDANDNTKVITSSSSSYWQSGGIVPYGTVKL